MKASMILAASGASLSLAGPLDLLKRVWQTEVVVQWTTVYVTEGAKPTDFVIAHHGSSNHGAHPTWTISTTAVSSPSSAPQIEQLESTSSSVVVVPAAPTVATTLVPEVTSSTPEPAPATTEAPAPVAPAPAAPVPDTTSSVPATTVVVDAASAPTDYESTVLYHHNIHRMNFSAPALEYGQTYADYAATTAQKCVFAHDLTPGGGGYGQNLAAFASSGDVKALGENLEVASAITDMWFNGEVNSYPVSAFGQPNPDFTNFEVWGHFSQLVWVNSKQVGCKTQFCPAGTMYPTMGAWFTVCNYFPAGNMGGQYGKNVLPPLNEPTIVV